ncbi:MAG: hypothetical protein JST40_10860 [Armatimonadetes bacterium]|nr:hypothetical protein [Armatimonadota bacterium]
MAGGSGERFWPMSRVARPKQLLPLADPEITLLEQTVRRLSPSILPSDTYLATAPHLVQPSMGFLAGLPEANVWAEPHKRNTAGCLVWVAANLIAANPEARKQVSMAVIAADHRITPDEGFRATIDAALDVAEATGGIVTIGIKPDRPETGYGYIEVDSGAEPKGTERVRILPVRQFREKPDRATAEEFLASGNYLWNSGTFFWTLDTFLSELESAAPDLYGAVFQIADLLREDHADQAAECFAGLRSISIDYALMEKANKVFVAEAAFDWDDVGSWDALDRSLSADEGGNVIRGDILTVDSKNTIVVNENPSITTCVLGVEGLVVVVTEDAVLVCPKDQAQQVRSVVEAIKSSGKSKF